jgi:5'-methylthioinosine phosphorylase
VARIAVIGGTGSAAVVPVDAAVETAGPASPFGEPSALLRSWSVNGHEVFFLLRHGNDGRIPPHRVNYRANIMRIKSVNPVAVIGLNAVGGITSAAATGRIVLPHQIIDYTCGREHTFFDGSTPQLRHVEFDPPFTGAVRKSLIAAARSGGLDALEEAVYGVTQGPRLETAAEIDRLAIDGCDIVGMTAMPEAVLAREMDLPYAIAAVVVNRAAGRLPAGAGIHAGLELQAAAGGRRLGILLEQLIRAM